MSPLRIVLLAVAFLLLSSSARAAADDAGDLETLARDLASDDPVARRAASRALVLHPLRTSEFRDGLMRGLADPDPVVAMRCRAILALARAARSDDLLELRSRVRFGEPAARVAAIRALRDLGAKAAPAVPELVSVLGHPELRVRENAAGAIGAIGPGAADAIPALIASVEINLGSAPQALSGIGRGLVAAKPLLLAETDHPSLVAREAILGLLVRVGPAPEVAAVFRRLLDDAEPRLRVNAVWGLPAAAPLDPETVTALVAALDDPAPRVRELAARGLGELGIVARDAAARLEALLADPATDVRRAAARALGRIRLPDSGAPDGLVALLDSEETVHVALETLARLGPPEAIVDATRRIEASARPPIAALARTVRWRACPAERRDLRATLRVIRDGGEFAPEAKAALLARAAAPDAPVLEMIEIFRKDPATHVGGSLSDALRRIGPADATPEILRVLVEWSRDETSWGPDLALDLIARFGPAAAPIGPDLLESLDAFTDDRPLDGLTDALAAVGRPVLEGLLDRLSGEHPERAARALAGMGRLAAPAVPLLLARARTGDLAAVEALGLLGPAAREAAGPLGEMLERDGVARFRLAVVVALARIGRGGRALEALLASDDPVERLHAAKAILLAGGVTAGRCVPLDVLLELARTGDPTRSKFDPPGDDHVRWLAVTALGEVGPGAAEATPLLYRLLSEARESPWWWQGNDIVGTAAYTALRRIWGE